MKAAKIDVDYSPGHARSHCGPWDTDDRGWCKYFEEPASCEKVTGHIDRHMWCKKFKREVVE